MEEKFMKLSEAILYTSLSRSTLHRLDRKGVLVPFRTKTNRRMYTKKMLDNFMKWKKIDNKKKK